MLADDNFSDSEKLDLAIDMLIGKCRLDTENKALLLQYIFSEYINTSRRDLPKNEVKTVDFVQDSAHIYSSFLMDYSIDLIDVQRRLHWWKFISLFCGLSEQTKMREIMSIRARKLPILTKYNGEEIAALRELKAYYALEISAEQREQNFQAGLASLAETLKERSENNGG